MRTFQYQLHLKLSIEFQLHCVNIFERQINKIYVYISPNAYYVLIGIQIRRYGGFIHLLLNKMNFVDIYSIVHD